jgi:hypothetical protein
VAVAGEKFIFFPAIRWSSYFSHATERHFLRGPLARHGERSRRTRENVPTFRIALTAPAKAKVSKVPPPTNYAETPATSAGRVTWDRPISVRVAGISERVACRRSASMVQSPYPRFGAISKLLRRHMKFLSATDRSLSTSSTNNLCGARWIP